MLSSESSPSALVCKKSQTGCPETRRLHDLLLEYLDAIFSCLIVAPCVVAYWRGTWELMGVLIFPDNILLSALMSFLIGGTGHVVFTLTQRMFKNHVHPDKKRLTYFVISRLYTAIFAIVCVNMWRGSWILCDWLTSADSLVIICIVTTISLLFLIATRTVRNLVASPYCIAMDHKSNYFDVGTMFKTPGFHQPGLFLLDTFFSVFVIGTLVVIAWRGAWGILDFILYPDNQLVSCWASLILGYIVVLLNLLLRPFVQCICTKLEDGILKLIICDIFYLMVFLGAVNVWRGIWGLVDVYVYPEDRVFGYWFTNVIPFLTLAALNCSNTLLVRGIFIDAECDDNGDYVTIPIYYVQFHFQQERMKKTLHTIGRHYYQPAKQRDNLDFGKSLAEKEAQSTLIEKDTAKKPQIQSGMDAGQIV